MKIETTTEEWSRNHAMDQTDRQDAEPNPDEHGRVLIFTEGYDFNGEQVFDVKAETLNECFYADPHDQPEVCRVASHWMPHPSNTGSPNWTNEQKAANALRDLMDALPAGTQTSMTAFRPEVNGQKAGTVKALLMADNPDALRCAQWVIAQGSEKRGYEKWPL